MDESKAYKILIIDDEAVIREGIKQTMCLEGYDVEVAPNGKIGLSKLQTSNFHVVVTDLKMPGMHGIEVLKAIRVLQPDVPVIIITGYATVDSAVEAMKNGAFDYLTKPFLPEQISEKINSAARQRELSLSEVPEQEDEFVAEECDAFVGRSKEMQKVYQRIIQVAPTNSTVLITGESGTGKELAARAIHNHSHRKDQPFVAVDCNSLPENLLESELFGHVKGSFTGATQTKPGLFSVANGGSLFLDEISNLSMTTQAKLLRVLQQREVTPIGGTKATPIDIRLIAATNKGLEEMVEAGTFRDDLYFRLNIIPVDLPPLRDRQGDVALLINYFMKKFAEEVGKEVKGLTPEARIALESYNFPGNVRELENIIERAVVLAQDEQIRREDLELRTSDENPMDEIPIPLNTEELKENKRLAREKAVEPVEKAFVYAALERNNWNVTKAAEETGMLRPNFQAMLKKLGVSVKNHNSN
ncbi:two component, sigma54 specific, transcriptional regulator, Fis family [Malonomonas rubra DSM 5091]|uniref:Two component, sigma54 specific, transcriptional regulator, Fis family n=1 Tax=Malonomonas rubra DSM 5091 TaxID=1122189 RepID=A0A1M6HGR1_MALRU|nr:sigma-54 dependent transcriptional regulator [Malonomonas rubra]SHJ21372.1 two component, sigma54 specific, transcriptional regulator, Fis family [Malonomonas rubra DSM 5091]